MDLFGGAGLFVADGVNNQTGGLEEFIVKRRGVAGGFEIAGGEAQDRGEGIEFVFTFVDAGLHFRVVGFPLTDFCSVAVEGVGVGVEEHAFGLTADEAAEEVAEFWAFFGEGQIGPDLVGGIAEPHGVDVAGDDKSVGLAAPPRSVIGGELHGGVEGVGEAVGEEPCEFGVFDLGGGFGDDGFDHRGGEGAFVGRRALGFERHANSFRRCRDAARTKRSCIVKAKAPDFHPKARGIFYCAGGSTMPRTRMNRSITKS